MIIVGYYATGDFTFTVSDNILSLIELMIPELEKVSDNMLDADTTLEKIVQSVNMEAQIDSTNPSKDDEGNNIIRCWTSEKWYETTEATLKWLGSHGVGIYGEVVGEDDQAWGYNTIAGSCKHVEYTLVQMPLGFAASSLAVLKYVENEGLENIPEKLANILKEMIENKYS